MRILGQLAVLLMTANTHAQEPIDLGARLELLVDDYLIDNMTGGARLQMHHPVPREVVLVHDAPWEGNGSMYHSVFQDGDLYRMYYRGWQIETQEGKFVETHPLLTCYAESRDGIHWEKPSLGLCEYDGSKANNIILLSGKMGEADIDAGHIAMFRDGNPACSPDARYKAVVRSRGPNGLLAFGSPDGIHWSLLANAPGITKGAFDSQNLAFWDAVRGEYRAYVRFFNEGVRDILTATSPDFLNWTEPVPLQYPGSPKEQLYTNQIKPYHRAPHVFIGFPARYVERGWNDSMRALPELEHRQQRSTAEGRFGHALTEGLLMTSRDGVTFRRWAEAFLRPGPQRPGTWNYGHQYPAWHVVETESDLPGAPRELSLYASESYWTGNSTSLRRYTLRLDGFVSVNAPLSGGELTTKPIVFVGDELVLNFATSAAGSIRVEVQDVDGKPVEGLSLEECAEIFGDELERVVTWRNGPELSALAGKPVQLRFVLRDADLYSLRFK